MPTIIANKPQMEALAFITEALDTVRQLNALLATEGEVQITMHSAKGKRVQLAVAEPERKFIISLCQQNKKRLVRDIRQKAARFRISLDKEDLDCMRENTEEDESSAPAAED